MTDRPDEPLSSEELIRRAREGLGSAADARVEPAMPEAAPTEPETFVEPETAAPEPSEPPPSMFEPVEPPPSAVEPGEAPPAGFEPAGPTRSDESLLPEHFQPEAGAPVTSERSLGRRILSNWRWIAAGVVGVFVLLSFLDNSKSVNDLSAGDCFQDPGADEVSSVDTVDCDEPHDYEVAGSVTLQGDEGEYPTLDAIFEEAELRCLGLFLEYTGITDEESPYFPSTFVPTREAWEDGDQTALCTVVSVDAAGDLTRSVGSAAGG